MKRSLRKRTVVVGTVLGVWLAAAGVQAYPPAPYHLIFGQVRDEMGNPLPKGQATLILETSSGVTVKTAVGADLAPGVNYKLPVPMDSGMTEAPYRPTALRPLVPFKLKVQLGDKTYLPIEMRGDYSHLGQAAQKTRIDLTLGEDLDGDGLPDAWERAWLARFGAGVNDVSPNDHPNGNGLSILEQYLAGTYGMNSPDGFSLKIVGSVSERSILEFVAIRGRSYVVYGSSDMQSWAPARFVVSGDDAAEAKTYYYAPETVLVRVEASAPEPAAPARFFKLMVQ